LLKSLRMGHAAAIPGRAVTAPCSDMERLQKRFQVVSGKTTNNRMEMMAVIEALRRLKRPCRVIVTTDSQYVMKGMTHWIQGWIKKNWQNSQKKPVLNKDLWQEMLQLSRPHQIQWKWVKGHHGHTENERCDHLAREALGKCKP